MKLKQYTFITACVLGLLAQNVWAGNITGIDVSSLSGNQKIVKVRFDRDLVQPSGFVTQSPARIALDFAGSGIALPQPVLEYNDSLLRQITAAESGNRTRLMLSLTQNGQYRTEIHGNEVWVYVTTGSAPAAAPTPIAAPAASAFVAAPIIESRTEQSSASTTSANRSVNVGVDFRKGSNGQGIISINSGSPAEPDVKRQPDRLILTYKNTPINAAQQRNLDVGDFSTPVRTISLRRLGNDTQLTISIQGNWDYSINNSGNGQNIEVRPNIDVANQGLRNVPKSFKGGKISLDFQNIDVRTILQILAKESGMNIVASDSVQGKMTISLKDVPWDQALDFVMQARNLDMRKQGNIINVAPRAEMLANDKAVLQSQNEVETLGPLVSQTFQLKYKNVEEFRKILRIEDSGSSNKNSILTSRGSALIDPATNTLIITDTPFVLQKFERLIAELDVPVRQVMIEARIVEANDGFSRALGVMLGVAHNHSNTPGTATWVRGGSTDGLGNYGDGLGLPNVNLPISNPTSMISIVRSTLSSVLALELQAMQSENRGKIISSPRILTQDRHEAVIESGTEVPYQEASSSGATSTSFKKAVLGLTVTPQITPDGKIIMDIKINKDAVDRSCNPYSDVPCIATQNLNTRAMVEDGGTVILGGVYREENSNTENKVPLLGDIPILGNLFKSRSRNQTREELLIFITPRVIENSGSVLRY
ncbi:type IV pilus secretin PilQ [Stenoxybacter acetivorans]|uniref:type IV pilus secretin PilQ n=1 Tax=Stenoxybacter acetivorans TaxID=422441 RepID=UPI0005677F65|nr:type IV pilus secretin PilQ [Stenoxybacter acetivorans]